MATLVDASRARRSRVRAFDHGAGAVPGDRDGQPAHGRATRSSSPISTTNRTSARGSALKERGIVFKAWEIDRDTLQPDLEDARQADGAAHAAGLRHARLQYPGHHQPDPRDRRFRACARRADLRRWRRLCPASRDRRTGARRRFLRVLALQDLRPASRRDVWPPRSSARTRRPLPLFLRQGESVGQAGAGQPKLRAGLGKCRNRRLSGSARRWQRPTGLSSARSTQSPRTKPTSASNCFRGCARATMSAIIGERGSASALRVPTISFTVEGKAPGDIVGRIDQAQDRRAPRRFPLAAPDRGAEPRAGRTRSASRWCTTTRRPR